MANHLFFPQHGLIEIICGCMYSGKSEELIRQLRRAEIAKQNIQVFKPKIDTRYSEDHVASHNQTTFPSMVVETPYEILNHILTSTQVIGIDEAQFFDDSLVKVAQHLASQGKRVLLAGLDTDYLGRPFGPMPELMATADIINKQYAICMVCGEPATRTQRLIANASDILIGSHGAYEARCRKHFDPQLSERLTHVSLPNSQTQQLKPTEHRDTQTSQLQPTEIQS